MTLVAEKYRQRLLELQLDIEKVQAYVLMCKVQLAPVIAFAGEPADTNRPAQSGSSG